MLQESHKLSRSCKTFNPNDIESYTVDVSSGVILYRLAGGQTVLHPSSIHPRIIELNFDKPKTMHAIRNNQQGKTDYPVFIREWLILACDFMKPH